MDTVQVQAPVAPQVSSAELRQDSGAQQEVPPWEQVWPELTHVAAWQVPNEAPVATTQAEPLQQSADAVQVAPMPWHTTGGPQTPAEQICEQQLAEKAQVAPLAVQSGPASTAPPSVIPASEVSSKGRQTPEMQKLPPQQFASIAQVPPRAVQLEVVQRSTPPSPGKQSAPLQH